MQTAKKMSGTDGRLTTRQRVRLANAISGRNMETIALGYLGFQEEEIKNLVDEHQSQSKKINRDILQIWCNKNSGDNQTKVSGAGASAGFHGQLRCRISIGTRYAVCGYETRVFNVRLILIHPSSGLAL